VVSQAVSRSSLAGKHHIRRLIREVVRQNGEIETIYVLSNEGRLLAHSDPGVRELDLSAQTFRQLKNEAERGGVTRPVQKQGEHWVRELVVPFRAGFEQPLQGILVMRVRVNEIQQARQQMQWSLLGMGLTAVLLALALLLWVSRRTARPLQQMAAQYRGILDNTPIYVAIYDRQGRVLEVSRSFLKDFPAHGAGSRREDWLDRMPVELARRIEHDDAWVFQYGRYRAMEYAVQWKKGELRYYATRKFPVLWSDDGQVEAICSIFWDITGERRAMARYELATNALQAAHEAIVITDAVGYMEQLNPALCRLLGREEQQLKGRLIFDYLRDSSGESVEEHCFHDITHFGAWETEVLVRSGQDPMSAWVSATPVCGSGQEDVEHYVFVLTDLSDKKAQEKVVEQLAYFDSLTGLPNRAQFYERLRLRMSSARRREKKLGLMLLDLDNFKTINDQLGHAVGDEVLKAVAQRLQQSLREDDTVARLGGDEFTIIVSDVERAKDLAVVADKLFDGLAKPLFVENQRISLQASVGIVLYPDDGEEVETLMQHVDLSMYDAKHAGKNRYHFFSSKMQQALQRRLKLERSLQVALAQVQFLFHYQPKVDLATGHVVGAEALIRWDHPEEGLLSPAAFIELVEQTGMIIPIMRQLLLGVHEDLQRMRAVFGSAFKLALNVSPVEFEQRDFLRYIEVLSREEGWNREQVELEITENMIMQQVDEAVQRMRELHRLGFSMAIDDFGTGFSSLNYLKRFPIHTLKIDRTFIRDLPDSQEDLAIVKAMIYMANRLNLEVVAEGVEHSGQVRWLHENGCRIVQGYFFGRPGPLDTLLQSGPDIRQRWQDAMGFVS